MMVKIGFGVGLPESGPLATGDNIVTVAKEAEALDYDSVYLRDHIIWPRQMHHHHLTSGAAEALESDQNPNFYESIVTLSYLAGITKKMRLGLFVLVAPLRHPILAAKQLSILDVLSSGRLTLGFGAGNPNTALKWEFGQLGVPAQDSKVRFQITEECIRAMIKLWTEPRSSFKGKYIKFSNVELFPKPLQKPHPVLLMGGATTPRYSFASRLAAELCDGLVTAWLTPEELRERVEVIRKIAREYNRSNKEFEIALSSVANIAKSDEDARRNVRQTLMSSLHNYEAELTLEQAYERIPATGSPSTIVRNVERYVDAGLTYLNIRFISKNLGELRNMMRQFRTEIMSSFR